MYVYKKAAWCKNFNSILIKVVLPSVAHILDLELNEWAVLDATRTNLIQEALTYLSS